MERAALTPSPTATAICLGASAIQSPAAKQPSSDVSIFVVTVIPFHLSSSIIPLRKSVLGLVPTKIKIPSASTSEYSSVFLLKRRTFSTLFVPFIAFGTESQIISVFFMS